MCPHPVRNFSYFCAKPPAVQASGVVLRDAVKPTARHGPGGLVSPPGVSLTSEEGGRTGGLSFPVVLSASLSFSFLLLRSPGAQPFLTSGPHPSARHSHPALRALLNPGPLRYSLTREQRWQDWALLAKPETKQMEWTADRSPAGLVRPPPQWEPRQRELARAASPGLITGRTCW